ncbi:MAG TPA: PIG-L family deacetylase [Ktedonobacterales bacterium]|nr:PIG-L family deacetylase [Ktedonobacterales bacterium]
MEKSILLCFAHPDDEVGCAPFVARYVAQGAKATLICATNGDVGSVDEKFLGNFPSIAALRLAELDSAAKAIGFTEVVTFGYRDSGMMGTADNDHESSLWHAPLEEVTERVVEVMRRVRPQVVVTFNTFGAYGHPDHIKINQATLAAFHQLQDEPGHPQKLYYTTGPRKLLNVGLVVMKLMRQNPRAAGKNHDMDLQAAVEAMTPITTRVPVAGYQAPMWAAMRSHASQIQPSGFTDNIIRPLSRFFMRSASLSRVYPEPQPQAPIERDLFANLSSPGVPLPSQA